MRIIGHDKLTTFGRKHANVVGALETWLEEIRRAAWLGWVAIEWVGTHAEYDKQTFR